MLIFQLHILYSIQPLRILIQLYSTFLGKSIRKLT